MRYLPAALGALLASAVLLAIGMRFVGDDPAGWHADPLIAERTGRPNDFLVAPEGTTTAPPDRIAATHGIAPRDLLFLLDAIAMNADRTSRIGGSLDDLWISYVHRSRVFAFPDYVSVRAIEVPGGSALVIWSRSRFGYGDMGVNRARVEDWLAKIGEAAG